MFSEGKKDDLWVSQTEHLQKDSKKMCVLKGMMQEKGIFNNIFVSVRIN